MRADIMTRRWSAGIMLSVKGRGDRAIQREKRFSALVLTYNEATYHSSTELPETFVLSVFANIVSTLLAAVLTASKNPHS